MNPILQRILKAVERHICEVSWTTLLAAAFGHGIAGWLLMNAVGDETLSAAGDYWWWHVVTSTTVGYGDQFPSSAAGRLVAVLWVMPGGFGLIGAIISKIGVTMSWHARKRMNGLGDYSSMKDHLVILGWQPGKTSRLVNLIMADRRYDHDGMVLVDTRLESNPAPDYVKYVRADSLASEDACRRSGLLSCEAVIVVGADDNETLTAALAASAACERHARTGGVPMPRIVANFADASIAEILRSHYQSAEVSVSLAAELLARAAQDPGSSEVMRQLLEPKESPSQFSMQVPAGTAIKRFADLMISLKEQKEATLIGVRTRDGKVRVSPPSSTPVHAGDTLYLIAAERILPEEVLWDEIG